MSTSRPGPLVEIVDTRFLVCSRRHTFMALDAGQETDNRIKRKMSVWWGSFKEGDTFVKQVHPSLDRFSGDPRTTKLMAR